MGQEQRAAQRIDLPEAVPAKMGDIEVQLVDVSLVGGRIEHSERVAMGATMPLRFNWRGEAMLIKAKVARTKWVRRRQDGVLDRRAVRAERR